MDLLCSKVSYCPVQKAKLTNCCWHLCACVCLCVRASCLRRVTETQRKGLYNIFVPEYKGCDNTEGSLGVVTHRWEKASVTSGSGSVNFIV